MRSLSLGAVLSLLLLAGGFFCGPLTKPAIAQTGITIGFAVNGAGLVDSPALGEELGRYIEAQLSIPVKVRSFTDEGQLHSWLTRFREVDIAWLNKDFLAGLPAGELYPLARNRDHSPGPLRGEIVARQGMNAVFRQQLRVIFLRMNENQAGRILLARLGTSRFITPEGEVHADIAMVPQPQTKPPQREVKTQAVAIPTQLAPPAVAAKAAPTPAETIAPVKSQANAPVKPQVEAQAVLPSATIAVANPPLPVKKATAMSSPTPLSALDQEAPIALVADYLAYNAEEKSYEARGDVVLRQGGVELKSDELLWQVATQDAAARGSVQLNDAGAKVTGDSLQYNMATGQGQVHAGQVFVNNGNFHLAGEQIEKYGQAEYLVTKGSFTTCDGEIPDWKFSAKEVDVTLGGYAKAKDVWFHVRDVPVFYTPYLLFPVETERESGLLMPWFGYSNTKGVRASLAWYQVIDRHLDATVYLDYLSEVGLGKGLEYRYALENQNNGKALFYHVNGFQANPDLYYLQWEHRGELPGQWQLTADIEYTDKQLFFENFGEVADDYNRDKTVSTLMLRRHWEKLNLVAHARYVKDLQADNSTTLQRLPELGLGLARYRLGDTPLYAGLESYATRFWREEGEDGERLYLRPSLSAVFKPGTWLEIVPEVAFYERVYNSGSADDEKFVPEFSLALATRMLKNYEVNRWGIERMQHSIEPKVTYTYIPDEFQGDLPLFDLYDRIERRNDITYELVNRLTSRSTAADGSRVYHEWLNLRLSQSYSIDEARENLSGENRPFSPLRVEVEVRPSAKLSLDAESVIPVYGDSSVQMLTVGAAARDDVGNAVKVNYSYKDADFTGVATDYVKFEIDTPLLKPIYTRFEERYDFRGKRELEKVLGLEYRSKCWSLLLTYRNRFREGGEDDQEFMLTFVLAGLGQNQGFGNGFGAVRQ